MSIQIGLSPLFVYGGGALTWLIFAAQLVFVAPRKQDSFGRLGQEVKDDIAELRVTSQRPGSVLLMEVSCSWADFVSDLSIALSAKFPNVALFVLMWVFLGAQVLPYIGLVFIANPPSGWLIPPPGVMLRLDLAVAAPLVVPAAEVTATASRAWCNCFTDTLRFCCSRQSASEDRGCACRALGMVGAFFWALLGGLCGFTGFFVLGVVFWVLVIASAAVWMVLWLVVWTVFIVIILFLRTILFCVGFLLYATKLISFRGVPLTQLFFQLWSEELPEIEAPSTIATEQGDDISVFKLEHEGVNLFAFHFTYITELLFESIAQLVIQILVAAFGGWSVYALLSIIFTSLLILLYTTRYLYWLTIRPCIYGLPFRKNLADLHCYYYSFMPESGKLVEPDVEPAYHKVAAEEMLTS